MHPRMFHINMVVSELFSITVISSPCVFFNLEVNAIFAIFKGNFSLQTSKEKGFNENPKKFSILLLKQYISGQGDIRKNRKNALFFSGSVLKIRIQSVTFLDLSFY